MRVPQPPLPPWRVEPPSCSKCATLWALLQQRAKWGTRETRRDYIGAVASEYETELRAQLPARRPRGRPAASRVIRVQPRHRPRDSAPLDRGLLLAIAYWVRHLTAFYLTWHEEFSRHGQRFALAFAQEHSASCVAVPGWGSFCGSPYVERLVIWAQPDIKRLSGTARELPLKTTPWFIGLAIQHRPPGHYATPDHPVRHRRFAAMLLEHRSRFRRADPLAGLELDSPAAAQAIRQATYEMLLGDRERSLGLRRRAIDQELRRRCEGLPPIDQEKVAKKPHIPEDATLAGELWYSRAPGEPRLFAR